jgi:hypothetical protein
MRFEVIDEHVKMSLDRLMVDVKFETVSFNHIELDRVSMAFPLTIAGCYSFTEPARTE